MSADETAKPPVAIIGAGSVGRVLARRLHQAGYPLCAVFSRKAERAQRLAERVEAPVAATDFADLPAQARLLFCCVPDGAVAPVARSLAGLDHAWPACTVAHTAGALTTEALFALAVRGATTLGFHPMQTFTRNSRPEAFEGIYVGLEGEEGAVAFGKRLVAELGARPLVIAAEDKARYHLAASLASNFLVTLMAMAGEVLTSIGLSRQEGAALLQPLVEGTVHNLRFQLAEDALTGPIARGDSETVAVHLNALATHLPHLTPFYVLMATEAVRVAVRGGRLAPDTARRLLDTLYAALEPRL